MRLAYRVVSTAGARRVCRAASADRYEGATVRQNDTVVVSVTRRGSPTATIRLLLLDG